MRMIAGPRMTTNSDGKMQPTSGNSILIGASVQVDKDKAILRQLEVPVLFAEKNDPNLVYLSAVDLYSLKCRFFTTTDGGYTWTEGTAPSLAPYTDCSAGTGQPLNFRSSMAESSDGTLYLAYAAEDPSSPGPRNVLLARSTDRGHNWTVTGVDTPPQPAPGAKPEEDFEPKVAIDPSNPKHVIVDFRHSGAGNPTRPYWATSNDGGQTFSTPKLLFDKPMGFDSPYPVFAQGKLSMAWHSPTSLPKGSIYSTSDKFLFSTTTDNGATWTDTQVATGVDADTPLVAWDSTRNRYDMYWNANGTNDTSAPSADLDIFFTSSADGKNWTTPVRVNDDPKNTGRAQWFPEMSLTPSGRMDMVWYDNRNDPFPPPGPSNVGAREDVYFASSTDGGATWSKNIRLNDVTLNRTVGTWNNQYYIVVPPAIVAKDSGDIAVWSDPRNGDDSTNTQDLYAAPIAYDPSTIPPGLKGASSGGYTGSDVAIVAIVIGVAGLLAGAGLVMLLTLRRRRATAGEAQVPAGPR